LPAATVHWSRVSNFEFRFSLFDFRFSVFEFPLQQSSIHCPIHLGNNRIRGSDRIRRAGNRPSHNQIIRSRYDGARRGRNASLVVSGGGGGPNPWCNYQEPGAARLSNGGDFPRRGHHAIQSCTLRQASQPEHSFDRHS
jgi:hypothetical protein